MQTASRPMDQVFLPLAAPATTGAQIPAGTSAALLIPLHDLYPQHGKDGSHLSLACLIFPSVVISGAISEAEMPFTCVGA